MNTIKSRKVYLGTLVVIVFLFMTSVVWLEMSFHDVQIKESARQVDLNKESMVISLSYYEQTANALKNLLDLQCWANSVNIGKVVEPAVFSLPGKAFHFSSQPEVTFGDYFNRESWNLMNYKHNGSILTTLEYFIQHSFNDVVYVQLNLGRQLPCKSLDEIASEEWFKFMETHNFNINTTCIDVRRIMSEQDFRRQVFSSYGGAHTVSVVFNEWRGIALTKKYRLQIDSKCAKNKLMSVSLGLTHKKPVRKIPILSRDFALFYSKKVLEYRQKFVVEHIQLSNYIVVMVRTEKLNYSIVSQGDYSKNFCMKKINEAKSKALSVAKTAKILYFSDSGAHGSSGKMYGKYKKSSSMVFSQNLEKVLKPSYSSTELTRILESITESSDSILIALVESALAVSADALILVGGGSFQAQTFGMFVREHIGQEKYFYLDSECQRL